MKKAIEFFKSNIVVIKWTLEYFAILSLILWLLFGFNVFSARHWWIFSHATLHGFGGLVFGLMMYSAIPIYIATAIIIYRTKEPIFTLKMPEKLKKIFEKIKNIFAKPSQTTATPETTKEPEPNTENDSEYPADMPRELYIPYLRAKQRVPLTGATSAFNKQPNENLVHTPENEAINESFPIPSDFDISDSLPDTHQPNNDFSDGEFPVFKDIDFDTPIPESVPELSNTTTKYFDERDIEYETYHDFIATEKYLIYEHNDSDFWVMDDDKWFASKKQHESPIPELLELAKQNGLTPVLYLESQNIMDPNGTIEKFESMGVRVIKSLEELD